MLTAFIVSNNYSTGCIMISMPAPVLDVLSANGPLPRFRVERDAAPVMETWNAAGGTVVPPAGKQGAK